MRNLKRTKKGQSAFGILKTGVLALGIAFITAAVVATVLSSLGDNLTGDAASVVGNGTAGVLEVAGFGTIFGTILAVVILMSLVAMISKKSG